MIRTVCDTGGQAAFVLMKAIIKTKKSSEQRSVELFMLFILGAE